ncbi:LLM class F420-dependent oxidoreductase [Nocardioides sp. W3-2-3]|uniref:LLM class F420-dependent oxidoreductase n=1 Tax=Nocardioides convexus TaxID=2712224 RepID=UPI0024186E73|nr:LLM class F420-dependent oxidoreductase [Nocardioides convexus]NGZ99576.1 LLM class F420-dependent oxidoreductase [Nocardioides convexus]
MELRVFTEPQQGATYDDLLAVALEAERLGFGAFFRSDHYLHMSGDGLPGSTDAWTTLAGLARETSTIRLGTMMTSATFRHPGVLAIQVAQVDQMSGGRVELGIGAGWFTQEHEAYGIPFPDTKERFERYAEQARAWSPACGPRRWGSATPSPATSTRLTDSPALPKPVQSRGHRGGVPILVGGLGKKKTPALAAAYADEFNLPFADEETTAAQFARVRQAAEQIRRDPDEITWSNALVLCVGADEAEIARRAAAIGREVDEPAHQRPGRYAGRGGREDQAVRGAGQRAGLPPGARPQ